MIYFILGIIVGILMCGILIMYRPVIVRTARQVESRTKQKGSIKFVSDEQQELSNFIDELPKQ